MALLWRHRDPFSPTVGNEVVDINESHPGPVAVNRERRNTVLPHDFESIFKQRVAVDVNHLPCEREVIYRKLRKQGCHITRFAFVSHGCLGAREDRERVEAGSFGVVTWPRCATPAWGCCHVAHKNLFRRSQLSEGKTFQNYPRCINHHHASLAGASFAPNAGLPGSVPAVVGVGGGLGSGLFADLCVEPATTPAHRTRDCLGACVVTTQLRPVHSCSAPWVMK